MSEEIGDLRGDPLMAIEVCPRCPGEHGGPPPDPGTEPDLTVQLRCVQCGELSEGWIDPTRISAAVGANATCRRCNGGRPVVRLPNLGVPMRFTGH